MLDITKRIESLCLWKNHPLGVQVLDDPVFQREGVDVHVNVPISISQYPSIYIFISFSFNDFDQYEVCKIRNGVHGSHSRTQKWIVPAWSPSFSCLLPFGQFFPSSLWGSFCVLMCCAYWKLTKQLSHRHRIYRLIKKAFMLHAIANLQVLIDSIKEYHVWVESTLVISPNWNFVQISH